MKRSHFKTVLATSALCLSVQTLFAQQGMGIGNNNPLEMLDVTGAIKVGTTSNIPPGGAGTIRWNGTNFQGWNGTAWINLDGSGGSSLDGAYDFSGPGLGRTITADAGEVLVAGLDGFRVTGTFGSGAGIGIPGAGTRMFFNPNKAAFRAGTVTGTQWDNGNIGLYSTAFGYNTSAPNSYATAMGEGTLASGPYSVAMGVSTIASGQFSTATGQGTTASGHGSFSTGFSTIASGDYSIAAGHSSNASNQAAVATGLFSIASGRHSTAMGFYTTASGEGSVALGRGSIAPSFNETVIGSRNVPYTPASATAWNITDRLFVIGNGDPFGAPSNALVMLKNGNTGIGISIPTAKLEVAGTVKIVDGTQGAGKVLTSDAAGLTTWTTPTTGTLTSVTADNGLTQGGTANAPTIKLGGALTANTVITQSAAQTFTVANNGTANTIINLQSTGDFDVQDNGVSALFVKDDGNVGIGTNVPLAKFHVNTAGSSTLTNGGNRGIIVTNDIGARLMLENTSRSTDNKVWVIHNDIDNLSFSALNDAGNAWVSYQPVNITRTGNVGIGTTAPGAKLEVAGQVKITGGTPGSGKVLASDAAGLGTWVDPNTLVTGLLPVGTSNQTLRHNGTNWIANSNVVNTGTNVGIGTSTPDRQLNIESPTGAQMLFTRDDNNTNDGEVMGELLFDNNDDTSPSSVDAAVVIRAIAAGDQGNSNKSGHLSFLTKNNAPGASTATERVRLTSAGNLGVGTSTPNSRLHVLETGTNSAVRIENTNAANGSPILFVATNGGTAVHALQTGTGGSGFFPISNAANGAVALTGQTNGSGIALLGVNTGTGPAASIAIGNPANTSDALTVSTNGTGRALNVTGKVIISDGSEGAGKVLTSNADGLATWVIPATSGTVTSVTADNGLTQGGTANAPTIKLGGALTASSVITQSAAQTFTVANTGTANTIINLQSTGDFDVQDNGVSALFVKDDGKVGVGTTAPLGIFSVGASNQWYVSTINTNTLNTAGNQNGTADSWINYRGFNDGFSQPRDLQVGNGQGAAIATFNGATNTVGIGTGTPGAKLDVTGTFTGTNSLQLRGGNTSGNTLSNQILLAFGGTESYRHAIKTRHDATALAGNAVDFYVWKFGADALGTVGTQHVMSLDAANGGSVGIGTTTPGAKLEVVGQVKITGGAPAAGKVLTSDASGLATWAVPATSGTVTTVAALTLNTTGTDFSSSVATGTTTPVITLNVPTASATNRGALSTADWTSFNSKESALTFSTGLTRTTNTITNNLSTGIAGGQSAIGGTAASQNLTLSSTSHATKGKILIGTSAYDEVNNRLGIGVATPGVSLDVNGTASGTNSLQLRSGNSTGSALSNQILLAYGGTESYRHAIKTRHDSGVLAGNAIDFYVWKFGTDALGTVGTQHVMSLDASNGGSVGIGTNTPLAKLHVNTGGTSTLANGGSRGMIITNNLGARVMLENTSRGANNKVWVMHNDDDNLSFSALNDAGTAFGSYQAVNITRAGRLGVGTTAPMGIFSVGATNQWYVSNTNLNTLNTAGNINGPGDGWINYRGYNDGFTQPRNFLVGNGQGAAIATFDGATNNVGIGTSAPSSKLDVAGKTTTNQFQVTNLPAFCADMNGDNSFTNIFNNILTNWRTTGSSTLFNSGNHFNPGGGTFIAPRNGYYFVSAQVRFDGISTGYARLMLAVSGVIDQNNGMHAIANATALNGTYLTLNISGVIKLTVGQELTLVVSSSVDNSYTIQNESGFTAYLVSDF